MPTCYLLTSCDPGIPVIKVNNDLSANVGQVLNLCPEDFPAALPPPTQTGTSIRQNPNDQGISGGVLISCCPGVDNVYTLNDSLVYYAGYTLYIPSLPQSPCWTYEKTGTAPSASLINLTGAVVYNDCPTCNLVNPCIVPPIITECTCFEVTETLDCTGSITLLSVPAIAYLDCAMCAPVCYLLTNCEDDQETIITYTNLEDYVGEVIKLLESCPQKCWSVTLAPDCVGSISVAQNISSFATCEACLPPIPEVPINLKTRAVKPGFYTLGCPPKYTLAVTCKFAEVVFSQMAVKRYGITPCCDDEDTNKWLIDKELLDLKALYDPSLCVSTIERCCPVKCLEVTLEVFRPVPCLIPANLVTTIIT